jgi:hypothetical protein
VIDNPVNFANAFVTKLNPTGTALVYSTYFGGNGPSDVGVRGDIGAGIALDRLGNAYVIGSADSSNIPVTRGAFQTVINAPYNANTGNGGNAFVTRLDLGATTQVATLAALSANANPAPRGAAVKFTASVDSSNLNGASPTGSATFAVDGKTVATAAVSAGKATFTTSSLALGKHTVQASFADSSSYFAPSSINLTETIELPLAAAPVFSPAQGTYAPDQLVTLTDATKGAVIHYTLTGIAPTATSPIYSTALKLTKTTKIEAIAVATGYTDSIVSSATYTIAPAAPTPTFSPAAGAVTSGQIVKIADTATTGLVIYYTTNGSTPTASSSKYTSAGIKVTATETIKAIAVATGYSPSIVASATYTVK